MRAKAVEFNLLNLKSTNLNCLLFFSSQIYLRIIANIQALAKACNHGVGADERFIKHNILQSGKIADDGVFNNRVIRTDGFIVHKI